SVEHLWGNVQTTNTTTTTVLQFTPTPAFCYSIFAQFVAARQGTDLCASFVRAACFRVVENGTVTRIGATPNVDVATFKETGSTAWSVEIDTSSGNIRFRVQGTDETVNWAVGVRLVKVLGGT